MLPRCTTHIFNQPKPEPALAGSCYSRDDQATSLSLLIVTLLLSYHSCEKSQSRPGKQPQLPGLSSPMFREVQSGACCQHSPTSEYEMRWHWCLTAAYWNLITVWSQAFWCNFTLATPQEVSRQFRLLCSGLTNKMRNSKEWNYMGINSALA